MSDEQMRAEFEAWASRNRYPLEKHMGDRYWYNDTERVWQAWQAARAQNEEPVAYLMTHPLRLPDCITAESSSKEDRESDAILGWKHTPLYPHPPAREQVQPQTNWFLYGERLPDEDDEDCEGNVWNYMPGRSSAPMLTTAGETRRRYETGIVVHWKPTGLERPEPPEDSNS